MFRATSILQAARQVVPVVPVAARAGKGHRICSQYFHTSASAVGRRSLFGGGGGGRGSGGRRPMATGGNGDGKPSRGLWGQYEYLLEAHPLATRCVTCALLNGLGDMFSQLVVEGNARLDWRRFGIFTALGLLYVGPILSQWYKVLPGMVSGVIPQLLMDQLLFAPIFIGSFMSVLTIIDGKPELIEAKLRRDLWPACKVNWMLWVPAQYINFRFVPPNLRVLAVNVVALIWNVYMSYQGHKKVHVEAAPAVAAAAPKGRARK